MGIIEFAKKTLRLPARIGTPQHLPGLTADILRRTFATSIGLLQYGWRQGGAVAPSESFTLPNLTKFVSLDTISQKLQKALKMILP